MHNIHVQNEREKSPFILNGHLWLVFERSELRRCGRPQRRRTLTRLAILPVAKDIRGHCATVAKRFSERTNRTHPPCSPHVFLFCPVLSCGGERIFSNQALWRECSFELSQNEAGQSAQTLNKIDNFQRISAI